MATITGTAASEILDQSTSTESDSIQGLAGDDTILGGTFDDSIDGGAGNDSINAGAGDDSILAGAGDDHIVAGGGADTIRGGDGNDTIDAGAGNDKIIDVNGSNSIVGGNGNDIFDVWSANFLDTSTLTGGTGSDSYKLEETNLGNLVVTDFSTTDADVIDVSQFALIQPSFSNNPFTSNYLRLVQVGTNTQLQWNQNTTLVDYKTVLTLQNVTTSSLVAANFTITANSLTPTDTPVSITDVAPIATAVSSTTNEDTAVAVTLTGTDSDGTISKFRISSLPVNGTLYSDAGLTQQILITADQNLAATGNARTVYFKPDLNWNGSTSFQYTAFDNLNIESTYVTATVNVSSVNDAPSNVVPATQTIQEDIPLIFSTVNGNSISINDVDAANNTVRANVYLMYTSTGTLSLTSSANLTVTGNNTTAIDIIGTQTNINNALNGLVFTPTANYNGTTTIVIMTNDLGNSGGTGFNPLSKSDSINVNITALNDAPVVINSTVTLNEDTTKTFSTSDFSFTDVENNALSAVIITSLPTAGTLKLNGIAVTANQKIPVASIPNLTFTPAANANGNSYASFDFKIQDNGGTANGGVDTSANSATMTLTVTPVNDAPIVIGQALFPTNILTNSGAEDGFTGWTVTNSDGASAWLAQGSSVWGDQHSGINAFLGSYGWGDGVNFNTLFQEVDLIAKGYSAAFLDTSPQIDFGVWVMGGPIGTDDFYNVNVQLFDGSHNQIAVYDSGILRTAVDWQLFSNQINNYATGVRYVKLTLAEDDIGAWLGNFGAWFDDAYVSIKANTFTENGAPVVFNMPPIISDPDLTNSNYAGATLTLARQGGSNAEDVFGTSGNLSFTNGDVILSGTVIGTVTNNAGQLSVVFNSNATQARLDEFVSLVNYSNNSIFPPANVAINWTLNDGTLSTTNSTIVRIIPYDIAPTLTAFSSEVASNVENTLTTINFEDLQTKGDEADTDGTVVGFVVKEVNKGILKIGTTLETATAWHASLNSTVDATHHAYWMPATNTSGMLNAFKVVALDNEGSQSATTIPVQVKVSPDTIVANNNTLINGSFEQGTSFGQWIYATTGTTAAGTVTDSITRDSWTYTGYAGLATMGSPWIVPATPNGTNAAFVQMQGSLSQAINFAYTGNYQITFKMVGRDGYGANNVDVKIDENTVGNILAASQSTTDWTTFTINYHNTVVGNHTLTFAGTMIQDVSSSIDDIAINFIPTEFKQGQNLTFNTLTIDGTNLGTLNYQWFADNIAIANATASNYTLTQNEVGKVVTGKISYLDNGIPKTITSSATSAVVNINDAPTGGVTISGSSSLGQTLTASNNLADVDGLGIIQYEWKANGSVISTPSFASSYVLTLNEIGKQITVTAIYTDGFGIVESVTSSAMTVPLRATTGNDIITGIAGADTLIGLAGDDVYIISDSNNTIIEEPNQGNDTLRASVNYTLPANVEILYLTGTNSINGTGNTGANEIYGNDAANILDDGDNASMPMLNSLHGGQGDDIYIIHSPTTQVIGETNIGGIDTVKNYVNNGTFTLSKNIENLMLFSSGQGIGNQLANQITGSIGNDTLNGGAGADILTGGNGDDTYLVDRETDQIIELDNQGTDTIQSIVTYTLPNNVENLTLTGLARIDGIGNTFDNVIVGNDVANVLTGDAGNDTLNGFGGNDALNGGLDSDILIGGVGVDTLTGGTGTDIFVFTDRHDSELGALRDVITDFEIGVDKIDLAGILPTATFTSKGTAIFDGENQIRWSFYANYAVIQVNLAGNNIPEFEIKLSGITTGLSVTDFLGVNA